jgi:hypothetical protein
MAIVQRGQLRGGGRYVGKRKKGEGDGDCPFGGNRWNHFWVGRSESGSTIGQAREPDGKRHPREMVDEPRDTSVTVRWVDF